MSSLASHSVEEWEAIKPDFLRLYIEENKKLDDVCLELADKHGFTASKKAFKSHITQWKAFKNYKASEKDELALYQPAILPTNDDDSVVVIRGKPVKWDRVTRHRKQKLALQRRTGQKSGSNSPRTSHDNATQHHSEVGQPLYDSDETLMRSAYNYSCWEIASLARAPAKYLPQANKVCAELRRARMMLDTTQRHVAWKLLNKVCEALGSKILTETYTIANITFLLGDPVVWKNHEKLSWTIFSYIKSLAYHNFITGTPIRDMLTRIKSWECLRATTRRLALIGCDLMFEHRSRFASEQSGLWFDIVTEKISDVSVAGYYGQARSHLSQLLQLTNLTITQRLRLSYTRVLFHYFVDDLDEAIALSEASILFAENALLSDTAQADDNIIAIHLSGMHNLLAQCYSSKNHVQLMFECYQKAFNIAYERFELQMFTRNIFCQWEKKLRHHLDWDSLHLLKEHYGFVYDTLNRPLDVSQGELHT